MGLSDFFTESVGFGILTAYSFGSGSSDSTTGKAASAVAFSICPGGSEERESATGFSFAAFMAFLMAPLTWSSVEGPDPIPRYRIIPS